MAKHLQQLELQLKERANELAEIQKIVRIALEALSLRLLTGAALVADCVMYGWALEVGSWQALSVAVLFSVASWCVLHYRPERGGVNET